MGEMKTETEKETQHNLSLAAICLPPRSSNTEGVSEGGLQQQSKVACSACGSGAVNGSGMPRAFRSKHCPVINAAAFQPTATRLGNATHRPLASSSNQTARNITVVSERARCSTADGAADDEFGQKNKCCCTKKPGCMIQSLLDNQNNF
ncbi:hypothetical protein DPEC_G00134670 [Dallia pectoralis]|uniref:Uncharacterized protein n=1 Tax=Dallia pectoralis TaxID=75939 RepID=A0ACC2GSJ1_DALPE|nr:hypothetical protein DPEC_G00134670 [Dallia pectoralis]